MQLPDKIKVGPYTFDIAERTEAWHRQTGDYGSMVFEDLQINIVTSHRPRALVVDTLIHEIFHAIWEAGHLTDKDDEEKIVATLATWWLLTWNENEELQKFVKGE